MSKRLLAEWEHQSCIQLMFPHQQSDWNWYLDEILPVFENIAITISNYQTCLVCYKDEDSINNIKHHPNIIFKQVNSNDTWCRDFGAITIENNDKNQLLDFTFNGWGKKFDAKKDDQINSKIFTSIQDIDFVLEGGSIDTNGEGVILTTSACLLEQNRNPLLNKSQIEKKLEKYLGSKEIVWLENGYLEGDDTDSHIDMLARFVNKDTIVYIKCDDPNDVHFESLQKMEEELKQTRFNLVALPWVSSKFYDGEQLPASYANFLIINGAILVPTYNDKNDKKVLNIFKILFPTRDIVGIDCSKIIRQHGSLHCLTMQYYNEITIIK